MTLTDHTSFRQADRVPGPYGWFLESGPIRLIRNQITLVPEIRVSLTPSPPDSDIQEGRTVTPAGFLALHLSSPESQGGLKGQGRGGKGA